MKQFIYVIALFLGVYMVNAQQTITGKVQDQDGLDLPGASIVVDGTNNATTSDFDGKYSLQLSEGTYHGILANKLLNKEMVALRLSSFSSKSEISFGSNLSACCLI